MQKLTRNAVECGQCGDIIESRFTHDFKWCSCHNVAVDGGLSYARRAYRTVDWIELSEYVTVPNPPRPDWADAMTLEEWNTFCDLR
jgi:hypothetical protein